MLATQDRMQASQDKMLTTQDRMLTVLVDVQERVTNVEQDVGHLKDSHDRTFRRIDDFLSTLGRHESEIAALRSSRERIEERVAKLEEKVGV